MIKLFNALKILCICLALHTSYVCASADQRPSYLQATKRSLPTPPDSVLLEELNRREDRILELEQELDKLKQTEASDKAEIRRLRFKAHLCQQDNTAQERHIAKLKKDLAVRTVLLNHWRRGFPRLEPQ